MVPISQVHKTWPGAGQGAAGSHVWEPQGPLAAGLLGTCGAITYLALHPSIMHGQCREAVHRDFASPARGQGRPPGSATWGAPGPLPPHCLQGSHSRPQRPQLQSKFSASSSFTDLLRILQTQTVKMWQASTSRSDRIMRRGDTAESRQGACAVLSSVLTQPFSE